MRGLDPQLAAPCIWMSAGLQRYRQCEGGPLDAALRGDLGGLVETEAELAALPGPLSFPQDRLYSGGHCWIQADGARRRAGLDALAAALSGTPAALRALGAGGSAVAGEPVVALDYAAGALAVASPVDAAAVRLNPDVEQAPRLVAADPYGEGWLFELDGVAAPVGMIEGGAMPARAAMDLRRFGRRAALHLLEGADAIGASLADGGAPLTDLRRMLGPRRYLALLREVVG